jgi:hypothetical protein
MAFLFNADRQERNARWLNYGLAVLALLICYSVASALFGRLVGFVVCVPILGAYISRLLVNHGASCYCGLRWLALNRVNGSYHAFDDLQVRVEWNIDQCRVAARDVFRIMDEKPDAVALRRLCVAHGEDGFFQDDRGDWWFGEAAVLQWLSLRAQRFDERAQRFHRWFEKDVFPPMRKKAELKARGLAAE